MISKRALFISVTTILAAIASVSGQNTFQGYSLTVEADNGGACPIRYLPSAGAGNAVEVFFAGTNRATPATGLSGCDGSQMASDNKVITNGLGRWCFQGAEPMY